MAPGVPSLIVLSSGGLALAAAAAAAAPNVNNGKMALSWASYPVKPDEHLLLQGEGLVGATVTICGQGTGSGVACPCYQSGRTGATTPGCNVTTLQASARSVKIQLPNESGFPLAIYNLTACAADGGSCASIAVNSPEVAFLHSHEAFPGGELRAFGRSLGWLRAPASYGECLPDGPDIYARASTFDWESPLPEGYTRSPPNVASAGGRLVPIAQANVLPYAKQRGAIPLTLRRASCYSLHFDVPLSAPPGKYILQLRNGLEGYRHDHIESGLSWYAHTQSSSCL